ncbi:MAG: 50S ribosomal protein L11 methyltransferase [Armatimonadetes bacterium]|nr:50S ribosomal protein L11 methyltransferase [Armatimonadota bacterium]
MHWLRCELRVPEALADVARGALLQEDFRGWEEVEEPSGVLFVVYVSQPDLSEGRGETTLLLEESLAPYGIGQVISTLQESGEEIGFKNSLVDDEDWAHSWKRFWKPMRIGARLVVVPSWEEYAPVDGDLVMRLDPGMAFGTGTHETTRMCLEWLETVVRPGDRLLDVGTGSGILSLAGLLLGASYTLGIDNDNVAVEVAQENLRANGQGPERAVVRMSEGFEGLAGSDGKFDVITGNLVADLIKGLAPSLLDWLSPEGCFVGSGIIVERKPDVEASLALAGFHERHWGYAGEWVSVVARRGVPELG